MNTGTDTQVFSIPDNNSNVLPWMLAAGNGGFGGNLGGLGGGILGFLIGMLFPRLFGGGYGGGYGGGNAAGTAYLGNMIDNTNGRDLLMQAVASSGERSTSAIQQLSTMLGQDFNQVYSAVQSLSQILNQISNNQGLNTMQVINSIQSGNASLQSQFCQCCCNIQSQLASNAAADQLAICQQTNTLQNGANANTQAILSELRAMQTQTLQDKLDATRAENTRLSGEISQYQQNQVIGGMISQAVNPLQAQLFSLSQTVDAIKRCQPSTITLPNNSMTAVPTIWANAVADNIVDRISAALGVTATTPTTPTTLTSTQR